MVEQFEPITWAEGLIEPARAADHPRLLTLYVMATNCWTVGRIEESFRYSEAGQRLFLDGHTAAPSGFESWLAGVLNFTGQPWQTIEWCHTLLPRGPDPYGLTRASLGRHVHAWSVPMRRRER